MKKIEIDSSLYECDKNKYFQQVEAVLKGRLKKNRYRHTVLVAATSAALAMRYGIDEQKAYLAGLLHDVAKHYDDNDMLKLCKEYGLCLTDFEKENPFILHGPVGAIIAQSEFDIQDSDILNAIKNHTVGRADMSILEQIVFIADYIEPARNKAKNLRAIRKLAFENLDKCTLKILEDTLEYLRDNNRPIDASTKQTYDFYLKRR